jgi:hypothetical protein
MQISRYQEVKTTSLRLLLSAVIAMMLFATQATAHDHSFIRAIHADRPSENVFRVDVEKIDGEEPNMAPNHRIDPGQRSVEVSLVFNSSFGTGMDDTQNEIYTKTFTMDVVAGKTYTIAAKVDTHASEAAQKDGSFWTPFIYKTE